MGEPCAALGAELLEEALHHTLAATLGRPHQTAGRVIDHQGQVALPAAPADLVDADALESVQTVVVCISANVNGRFG